MRNGKWAIAIIGCGGMGAGHAYALGGKGGYTGDDGYSSYNEGQEALSDLQSRLTLAGVYDINPARMDWARDNGFGTFDSYEAMLADGTVDIILIATPNHLHRDMALKAFDAGKHVLCEKPVMMSAAELETVLDAAKSAGKVFYPRQNRRWDKDFLIFKQLFEKNAVGRPFCIESRVCGSRGIPGDWRAEKQYGGGMMLDWGVHLLDRIAWMVPEKIKTVYCHMTHVHNDAVDDGFQMHLLFESGLAAVVEVGTCHFVSKPLWYLAGEKGTVQINDWDCRGEIAVLTSWEDKDAQPILAGEGLTKTMAPRTESSIQKRPLPELTVDRDGLYLNLVDVIEGKAGQVATGEQALRVLRLMEAAVISDAEKRVVAFE